MPGNSSSSKHPDPKRGPTGVNKKLMKTRQQTNQEAEALKQRMNDLESDFQQNKDTKEHLEKQLEQVQARAQGTNGKDHDQNEREMKDLLNQLDGAEEKDKALSAQIEDTRRGRYGSEMETDEVDRAAPNFAQTRDEDIAPDEVDRAAKTDTVENRQPSRSDGGTNPQPMQTGNVPIQSVEQEDPAHEDSRLQIDDDSDDGVLVH